MCNLCLCNLIAVLFKLWISAKVNNKTPVIYFKGLTPQVFGFCLLVFCTRKAKKM